MSRIRLSSPSNPFDLFGRLLVPSAFVRVLWLSVAFLHVGLICRRLALGETMDWLNLLRGFLCLIAIGYASFKFWRIATLFDSKPRRALVFGLILILGHVAITPPASPDSLLGESACVGFTLVIAVLPSVPLLGLALLLLATGFCLRTLRTEMALLCVCPIGAHARAHLPITLLHLSCERFRRPPPFSLR